MGKQIQKSLIKNTDMTGEQSGEVVDIIVGSIDKFSGADGVNIESAGKTIKEALDKQYGTSWHCVIGKALASISPRRSGRTCSATTKASSQPSCSNARALLAAQCRVE